MTTHITSRRLYLLVLAGAGLIEASLLFRLWVQLTDHALSGHLQHFVYWVSNRLVEPFTGLDTPSLTQGSGVIQFSTLVALEAYFVVGLVLVGLVFIGSIVVSLIELVQQIQRRRRARARTRLVPATSFLPAGSVAQPHIATSGLVAYIRQHRPASRPHWNS